MRQSKTTNSTDYLRKHHVSQRVTTSLTFKAKARNAVVLLTGFKPMTSGLTSPVL